jgi:hypothetical protein
MAEQQEPLLLRDTSDGIATLTLNRPKQRNALSMQHLRISPVTPMFKWLSFAVTVRVFVRDTT